MKKTIAAILALTTAANMAMTVMAQAPAADMSAREAAVRVISFDKDENGVELTGSTVLTPKETYYFPVMITEQGATEAADLTNEQFKNLKFHFANEEGKSLIESMKIEKHKSKYSLVIKTKANSMYEVGDVSYTVQAVNTQDKNEEIQVESLNFQVGYQQIPDSALKNPAYVQVDPATPVITEENFKDLNDLADGEEVTFGNGDWEFSVKVKGMKTQNMYSSEDEIDAIVEKYGDQEFKFVSFPMGPLFRTEGTLTVDVGSEMNDFEDSFYVYMYDNGKLVGMNSQLDEDAGKLMIKTKQLGRFVITNKAIKDTTVTTPSTNGGQNSGSQNNGGSGVENPSTGASELTGLAVSIAANLIK